MVRFLYLSKENEPAVKRRKKGQPVTWFACSALPCAAHKERTTSKSRTPNGVPRRVVIPFFISLLGSVKWLIFNAQIELKCQL